jgi:ketosteroid isomerase-like protein
MRRSPIVVVAVLVASSALAFAQGATTQKPPANAATQASGVEATLTKMEHDATAALIKKDVAGFAAIFAEDATVVGPDGAAQTKAQLLADVKSGALAIESSQLSDIKIRVFGETAIVTYTTTDKGKYKTQDISGRYRWTDVFAHRGGKWQIVAGQGTPIPK